MGSFPQIGVKTKHVWNHPLVRCWLKDSCNLAIPYLWQHKWKAQAFEERHGNYLVSQGFWKKGISFKMSLLCILDVLDATFSGQNGWKLHIEFKKTSNRDGVIWPASSFASVALTPHVSYLKLLVSSCTNPATRTSPTVSSHQGAHIVPIRLQGWELPGVIWRDCRLQNVWGSLQTRNSKWNLCTFQSARMQHPINLTKPKPKSILLTTSTAS